MELQPATPTYRHLAAAFVVYTIGVVLWGAFVRASLSGDGCGDHWPLCDGEIIPVAPSTKKLVELTHRITSGVAWIGALAFWMVARRRRRGATGERATAQAAHLARTAFWGFFFMSTEALVGAGLVIFRMVADNPDSARGYWVGAHLINTFVLVAVLTLHARAAYGYPPFAWRGPWARRCGALLGGVLVVGITGAIAALGDTLFPASSLAEGLAQDADPSAHVFLRLRVSHPIAAVVVAAGALALAARVVFGDAPTRAKRLGVWLAALTVLQVAVGLWNLAWLAPIWLQLVHLGLADALWIALVLLAAELLPVARAADSPTPHAAVAPGGSIG